MVQSAVEEKIVLANSSTTDDAESQKPVFQSAEIGEEGAQITELMQEVWGKHGKLYIFLSIAICMIVYELDNTTFATYYIYALSDFQRIASSAALAVACNLVFALIKPIWAKLSDIIGRGSIYPIGLLVIVVGLVVAASAKGFTTFAVGTILRVIGVSCLNTMNTIVISDVTTTRQRGLGVNLQFWPYLVLPWVSAYIVSAVVSPGGIGWAWGIGILAIIFPFGIIGITFLLIKYQRRAKKLRAVYIERPRMTFSRVCSSIDVMGMSILILGLAFILLPLSIAKLQKNGYRTPWVIALMVIGGLMLLTILPYYEGKIAKHPFFPPRYLKHRSICLAFLLYFTDYMAAEASHSYLYNWALIAQGFSIVQATNLSFINSTLTFASGIVMGLVMWKTKQYKWWIFGGLIVRIIGYGVMFRIRTSNPSLGEIFVVQIIQGVGDGIVQSGCFVAATVNVPHRETAQMTALVVMIGVLGQSIGSAISGAIYTGTFREELSKQLDQHATPELIEAMFNSITTSVPDWGTPQRNAINAAYNNVTSYFYIAAVVIIVPALGLIWFLPNQKLTDNQNLLEEHGMFGRRQMLGTVPAADVTQTAQGNPGVDDKEIK